MFSFGWCCDRGAGGRCVTVEAAVLRIPNGITAASNEQNSLNDAVDIVLCWCLRRGHKTSVENMKFLYSNGVMIEIFRSFYERSYRDELLVKWEASCFHSRR